MTEGKIMVEREPYEKDGKTYQSYFIRGTVRGVDFRVRIVPPDFGGYTVLDIVYAGEQEAELVLVPYEITDEKTGRVTRTARCTSARSCRCASRTKTFCRCS